MRLDTYKQNEARRAAERPAQERPSSAGRVQVPGAGGADTPAALQARINRAAELARLERTITEKRVHVRQLLLCAGDFGTPGRDGFLRQHETAAAELRELEERAAALSRDSPA